MMGWLQGAVILKILNFSVLGKGPIIWPVPLCRDVREENHMSNQEKDRRPRLENTREWLSSNYKEQNYKHMD